MNVFPHTALFSCYNSQFPTSVWPRGYVYTEARPSLDGLMSCKILYFLDSWVVVKLLSSGSKLAFTPRVGGDRDTSLPYSLGNKQQNERISQVMRVTCDWYARMFSRRTMSIGMTLEPQHPRPRYDHHDRLVNDPRPTCDDWELAEHCLY